MANVSIYVGTYNKYNSGSIFGKWIDLTEFDSVEDFYKACKKLHSDEEDSEFMFQDYEVSGVLEAFNMVSECHIDKNIFKVLEAIESSSYDESVFEAYVSCFNPSAQDIEELEEKISDSYQGTYDSDKEFVQNLLEETEPCLNTIPTYISIDWESTARDIMMDYYEHDNHYFRAN